MWQPSQRVSLPPRRENTRKLPRTSNTLENVDKDSLFELAQAGDEAAWKLLFEECYPKVQRYVRQKIRGPMRRYVDSTDIANDVFTELAVKASGFRFGHRRAGEVLPHRRPRTNGS